MAVSWEGTVLCVQKLMEMYLLGGPMTACGREQLGVGQRCQASSIRWFSDADESTTQL